MRNLLGSFELVVLLAVIQLGEDAYGVPVAREVVRASRRNWSVASVYAALDRLEKKGLVASALGESTPERGGRAKKYFQVTASGLRIARETKRTFAAFWPIVQETH